MGSIRLAARSILVGILTFFALSFILFVYWKHFPIDYLVGTFINPHSLVPRATQVQMAEAYLHLNLPLYLQYFGFLDNVFTGSWAYSQFYNPIVSGYYTFQVYPVIANTLPTTLFIMFIAALFSMALTKLFPASSPIRGKKLPVLTGLLSVIVPAIAVPLILKYIITAAGFIYGQAGVLFSGPGYNYLPAAGQNWINTYIPGVLIHTTPTGIPLLDALVNFRALDAVYLFRQMVFLILAAAISLFISYRLLRRAGGETAPEMGLYFVFAIVFATAFTEYIFGYFGGMGYYAGFLNPFGNNLAIYATPNNDVWLQVYLLLTYGTMGIAMAVGASLIRIVSGNKTS